ncbi:hypothetical protein B0T16DRAFT_397661 [Cercophora newfieldiana]|uniref:2EXR domain-containing protein n=1 Tax=Cercophora newfieldiana TaxID=92897 RepID=A0AA39YPP6_9PEZI|nr:hypothetical protein B0T16DRAFT_397661 [Cercophora newfieldiana]
MAVNPDMATEFHFFPLLPWELRDMIWKFAIRPALPGAHIFRISTAEHRTPEQEASGGHCPQKRERFVAPQCLPRGFDSSQAAPISWTLNNPSMYLVDGGLWTACKESLQAIDKEFQKPTRQEQVWSASEVESSRKKRGRLALPDTATYAVRDNSRHRYITVFPERDLFILQSPGIPALDCVWINLPTFRVIMREWAVTTQGGRHMALKYDPAWDTDTDVDNTGSSRWDSIHSIITVTAFVSDFSVWFIVRRNPMYQGAHKPSRTFYATDRRFVEVDICETGEQNGHSQMWNLDQDRVSSDDHCSRPGPVRFVESLRRALMLFLQSHRVKYGLLACEYL